MILYSKNGEFLGIGKDELSFLGFEDLDEFKSLHSDVADLFINRPGYIFKFKNFSWIDYALHSGVPKKSVIVKLKTGNEAESSLSIKEIFLISPKNSEELYYSIEFVNSVQNGSTLAESILSSQAKQTVDEKPLDIKTFKEKEELREISFEENFIEELGKDISDDSEATKQKKSKQESALKLGVDNNIFKTDEELPKEAKLEISDNFIEDYRSKESLKVDTKEKKLEPYMDINTDYITNTKEEDIDFDLTRCIDELNLDISLVSELITDYINKIDETLPVIKSSLEKGDEKAIENSTYKLKGISDNLYIHQLSSRLEDILKAKDLESKRVEFEKFEKFATIFKRELA